MKYLLIENEGEIDVNALILMGGTTKRDDKNSIGFFGSGNKYSIAVLLNKGINFKIFSGEKEIEITTKEVNFRDTKLNKIYIDGIETSLTTTMGGDQWETWFVCREWLSNAIDEGGVNIINETEITKGSEGKTRVYIEHVSEIIDLIDNWNNYFTFDREDVKYEQDKNKIYHQIDPKEGIVIFRRGIRAYKGVTKSLYQYDLHDIKINESRVVQDNWEANNTICRLYEKCNNVNVIQNILKNASKENVWENELNWFWATSKLSKEWEEAIGNSHIIVEDMAGHYEEIQLSYPYYIVSRDLARRIKSSFPEIMVHGVGEGGEQSLVLKKVEISPRINFLLNECNRFFTECKYEVIYPIEVVNFKNKPDCLGYAKDNTIFISEKLFNMGKREIAVTIIEENEHLKTGFKDCSRNFQQHFINLFISTLEEKHAFFL